MAMLRSEKPRRFGLRTRLLALLLPGLIALLALDSWNDYRALTDTVTAAWDESLLEPVHALANSIVVGADGSVQVHEGFSVEAMFGATSARYKQLHVGVAPGRAIDPAAAERTLLGASDLPAPPPSETGKAIFYDAVYRQQPLRIAAMRQTVHDNDAHVAWQVLIQAAESTSLRDRALSDSLRQGLWRDTRMLLVVTLLVWLGIAWTLRPLERLRDSLRARRPDDLQPLDAGGVPQEVVPLVEAVNHHIESHRRMLADHARFLADASHQLRTPLAILSIQAGYAVRETDPARMRESLDAIVVQLARTRRLSEQLLAFAHATHEDGNPSNPAHLDLGAVARAVVLQYLPLAREKQQDLGWMEEPEDTVAPRQVMVKADEAELHEVLSNLVHNAIKYTPVGGTITVSARCDGASAVAEVSDNGPGIAPERRAQVFERFQRDAGTAAEATRGAGLGLAIARGYARRQGGEIELADPAVASGLRAILRLPLATDA